MPNWISKHIFPHQHPDAALRYIPIVKLLKKNNWTNNKILEIGSGSYGITPYLNKPVTGIDTDFSEPETSLLKQVRGVGQKLPFKNQDFDIVIVSDVLEHMPENHRAPLLQEAIRVAKVAVIVGGPFGQIAFSHDKKLSRKLQHHFLLEHLKYGLPEVGVVTNLKNPRISSVDVVGEYLNLHIREMLMTFFSLPSKIAYWIYLKGLMVLVPVMSHLNSSPCYRTVILLRLKP